MLPSSSLELDGKHILVTGAGSGIGTETSRLLAALGAKLTLTDIMPLDDLVRSLREDGATVDAFQADLTKPFVLDESRVADLWGLVLLTGLWVTLDWMEDDEWEATFRHIIDVNVVSSLRVVRACLPILERLGRGRVVVIGSSAGRMGGDPKMVQPHYTIAKSGMHALTYNLAKRYGPKGIAVNGVAPGTIATPTNVPNFAPDHKFVAGRMGTAAEVAWPIAFLCSPHVSYMSGTIIDVNGGSYMK